MDNAMKGDSDSSGEQSFHPLFSSPDADVVLASKDQTQFRVHSYTLKTTSGCFRGMFSLPTSSQASTGFEVIRLEEDSDTLERLLRMICGLPVSP